MLRDPSLIPLSRQHQHALALCVRIDRAPTIGESELATWQAEVAQQFEAEIRIHFAAEERFVFPEAKKFLELVAVVDDLLADHVALRELFAKAEASEMTSGELRAFGERLSAHIRKEERLLFERLQSVLTAANLAAMGKHLDDALQEATQTCALPARPNVNG